MNVSRDSIQAARGAVAIFCLQGLTRVFGVMFIMVVTRKLSAEEFGRYSIVAAVVLIGGFLSDFGTTAAITRSVSQDPRAGDDVISGTVITSFLLGLGAFLTAALYALAARYPSQLIIDILIGSLGLPIGSVASSLLGALDGFGQIANRALLNALQSAVVTIGGAVAVWAGMGVRPAVVVLGLAPLATLVGAALSLRRRELWSGRIHWDTAQSRRLLSLSLPIAISGGVTALTMRADVLLVSILSGNAETATYDVAVRAVEATAFVSTAIAGPFLYLLSGRTGRGDMVGAGRAYGDGVRIAYLLGAPVSALLACLGGPIASLAFGGDLSGAAVPLAVLGSVVWVQYAGAVQGALTMSTAWLSRGVRRAAGSLMAMLVLDLGLVPRYGATGAAWASLIATVGLALAMRQLFSGGGVLTPLPSWRLIAAVTMMIAVLILLRPWPVFAAVSGILVYASAVRVTGAVRSADVMRLLQTLRGAPGASAAS